MTQIELYDVVGGVTSIRSVPILESYGSPTALELQDGLPLGAFLAPVASCKDALAAALETLEPCEPLLLFLSSSSLGCSFALQPELSGKQKASTTTYLGGFGTMPFSRTFHRLCPHRGYYIGIEDLVAPGPHGTTIHLSLHCFTAHLLCCVLYVVQLP